LFWIHSFLFEFHRFQKVFVKKIIALVETRTQKTVFVCDSQIFVCVSTATFKIRYFKGYTTLDTQSELSVNVSEGK
jgi:hypothetical protein